MNLKKIIGVLLILVVCFIFGCGIDPSPKDEPTIDVVKTIDVTKWIENNFGGITIDKNITFPDKYLDTEVTLTWTSKDTNIIKDNGEVVFPKVDTDVELECSINNNNEITKYSIVVTVIGKKDELDLTKEWLDNLFKNMDESNLTLPTVSNVNEATITWESSNPDVIANDGKITKQELNVIVELKATIKYNEKTLECTYSVKVTGLSTKSNMEVVIDWVNSFNGKVVEKDIELPLTHPTISCTLTWMSFSDLVTDDGKFTSPILDTPIEFLCQINCDNKKEDVFIDMVAKGSGTVMDAVKDWVKKEIGENVIYNFRFPTEYAKHRATFTWSTSDESIISLEGTVTRPLDEDKTVTLTAVIVCGGKTETYSFDVKVLALAPREKAILVKNILDETFTKFNEINSNLDLPKGFDEYKATINWVSSFSNIVSADGEFTKPMIDSKITLTANIIIGTYTLPVSYAYDVKATDFTNIWDAVETFVKMINYQEIKTQKYQTFGSRTLDVINYGYLPFYNSNPNPIEVKILDYTYGRVRTGIEKKSTEYIVVHDTGNNSKGSGVDNHWNYLNNLNSNPENTTSVSWHFTVGEDKIMQNLPLNEVAWHAGDGRREWGQTYFNTDYNKESITGGNMNGIGIESCVDEDSDYNKTMRNLARLVAELMMQFNLSIDRVKQHNAFSGKDCPMTMRHADRWDEFLFLVQLEYFAKTKLKDVSFKWKSLSPEVLNNNGEIIVKDGLEKTVEYEVEVTYNNEIKTYKFTSKVLALK